MKKLLVVLLGVGLCTGAFARPEFYDLYKAKYGIKDGSKLAEASCANCHTSVPSRNAYGKEIGLAMKAANTRTLNEAILGSIEDKDSDGDGWTNLEEIKADTLPGDPSSHPKGSAPKREAPKTAVVEKTELIPTHSFHPAVVHFPIALLVIGALLEFWGWRKKDLFYRKAGYLNLILGTISTAVVIPTGVAAWLRKGMDLKGDLLIHVILASVSVLLMLLVLGLRKRSVREDFFYFGLLLLACILVSAAGHFGGNMVYS